ncbi:hypothetical protein HWQ46_26405 [Shewanella sp. D64]|uniref:hypothetical protein n=1 Tax=unclassified Shewanella TaxID=196818 RepID=UPI0022BA168E|nr:MULTISPECIES: hypothetical protein [unclassified Shewanella]MEC4729049.1 hypothetical protein [Shewanella sp. D64]MEC4737892.1 hypothetical protein [Shewanella sp. E94]WBJ93855.1 hypothetical protein HWQ47_18240 [Shewanella sp. MTB7]
MKCIFALLILLISTPALAKAGSKSGVVEYIRTHDGSIHTSWEAPIFWFTLAGVTSAGSCGTWNGRVLFVMDTDHAYSMILAAHMAGKDVGLRYDDEKRAQSSTYCKATFITLGSPVL